MANFPENTDEKLLIANTLRGNHEAFRPLVEKYWGLVSSIVQKYIKNRETAADLCQEVFLAAFTGLPQYRHDLSFSPWLAKIAVNKALEHLRRENRAPFADFDLSNVLSQALSPDEVLDQKQLFDDCIACLPEKLQILFILRHGLDFSYEDLAYVLDMPAGTVKSIMFRMRSQLRSFLESREKREKAIAGREQEFDV